MPVEPQPNGSSQWRWEFVCIRTGRQSGRGGEISAVDLAIEQAATRWVKDFRGRLKLFVDLIRTGGR
jgi:hypothetical protein